MRWRSLVVVAYLGLALGAPAVSTGQGVPPVGRDAWQLAGARALLRSADPALLPPALLTLGELRSAELPAWITGEGAALLEQHAELRVAASEAEGKLPPDPAALTRVLERWKRANYPGISAECDALRHWRASDPTAIAATLSGLSRPPKVQLVDWYYCVGAWSQVGVDEMIDQIKWNGLRALFALHVVVPAQRPEAARKLLALHAASPDTTWLNALGALRYAGPEVLAPLEQATATPALRATALEVLAALVPLAPAGSVPEARLEAWSRMAGHPKGGFFLMSPRLQGELAAQLKRSGAGCPALPDELPDEPAAVSAVALAPALLEAIRTKLAAKSEVARACGEKHGYAFLPYERKLGPVLAEALRAHPDASRQTQQLAALVQAGAAPLLIDELSAAYVRAADPTESPLSDLSEALAAGPLPEPVRSSLRPALVAYARSRAPGWVDWDVGPALRAVGPITRDEALGLIERTHADDPNLRVSDIHALRAWAVLASGGDSIVVHAARWLAARVRRQPPVEAKDARAAVEDTLAVLQELEPKAGVSALATPRLPEVDGSALAFLRALLDDARWTKADAPFLRGLLDMLPATPEMAAVRAAIERRIAALEATPDAPAPGPSLPLLVGRWAVSALGVHFLVWLGLLLVVYPRSRLVQAAMLFNPLGRAVTGLGYTQLLVLVSPWLRRRLFHPLVDAGRDAEVASYDAASFYAQILVAPILPRKNPQAPIELGAPIAWTSLASLDGVVVIEGASGLGKTHVLKALLERSRAAGRTCLFVRAAECNGGVMKEIEDRLAMAHSSGFVRSMVHRGAIELYLDGLNEAQPSGVAEIAQFCERARNARILITTQPMSWACPRHARRVRLLPLSPDELEAFLMSQWPVVRGDDAPSTDDEAAKQAYLARVQAFLAGRTSPRDLAVLQNRIDLAFVAHVLARGQRPNIHSLRKQVVDDAAAAYEAASPGGAFPLAELGAAAVRVLESGNPVLDLEGGDHPIDPTALAQLADRKLLLHRGDGAWLFRHDTITCYFAAQGVFAPLITAEAVDPRAVTAAHLTSPRFFGVYLQLAEALPLPAAEVLASALRDHGRDSHDRTLEIAYQDLLDRRAE